MQYAGGNRLTLLRNGEQYFPALVGAIDAARLEVFLESYIYADDETGSLVTDALARAAARGVRVRLLIDGFGARDFAPRFRSMLRGAGAQVLTFRPEFARLRFRRGRLRRMHRKLAAIDGATAFARPSAGRATTTRYASKGRSPPRCAARRLACGGASRARRCAAARRCCPRRRRLRRPDTSAPRSSSATAGGTAATSRTRISPTSSRPDTTSSSPSPISFPAGASAAP